MISTAAATTVSQSGDVITVSAAPGERNSLNLDNVPAPRGEYFISDVVPITAGPGCRASANTRTTVVCAASNTLQVRVDLGDGDDRLSVGKGPASVRVDAVGGVGNDQFSAPGDGAATTRFDGGPGDDSIDAGGGADALTGGDGKDTLSYVRRGDSLKIVPNGIADDGAAGEGDNLGGDFETIYTGAGNDTIVGNPGNNYLSGGAGNDVIDGGAGDDSLHGLDGDDALSGGPGQDGLTGGGGNDRLTGGSGSDVFNGKSTGNDTVDARDGEADGWIGCDGPTTVAVVDAPLDYVGLRKGVTGGESCSRVDELWVGPPTLQFPAGRNVRVTKGRARITILCRAQPGKRCRGRVRLTSKRGRGYARTARYSLAADKRRTLRVRLTSTGRRALRRSRRGAPAVLRVSIRGGKAGRVPVALRR